MYYIGDDIDAGSVKILVITEQAKIEICLACIGFVAVYAQRNIPSLL